MLREVFNRITLIHPGRICESLPVESITRTHISVRWGLNGIYDIDLRTNEMKARSIKARNRARCYWKIRDIELVRKQVEEYFRIDDNREREEMYKRHAGSMPK